MNIDGRAIAEEILKEVSLLRGDRNLVIRIVVTEPSAATESYLRTKQKRAEEVGIQTEVIRMEHAVSTEDVIRQVVTGDADAVIVQLPLPSEVDTARVLASLPVEKDVDVLSDAAYLRFEKNETGACIPPVAGAVLEILNRSHIEVSGKRAVVVGQGRLVGMPVLTLLRRLGADVVSIYKETPEPEKILKEADIVVSGAGDPHFITPEMVKDGAILVDAGTSELGGALVGDFHPGCATKASLFTPVPGGVGPIAVARLLKNVVDLQRAR